MTLSIERHDGKLWLCAYETPAAASCMLIAQFRSDESAELYKAAIARTMLFARETGRSGLG